jgi:hypothetical protein
MHGVPHRPASGVSGSIIAGNAIAVLAISFCLLLPPLAADLEYSCGPGQCG